MGGPAGEEPRRQHGRRRTQAVSHLVIAAVAAIITVAMAYYLKNLRRFVSHR